MRGRTGANKRSGRVSPGRSGPDGEGADAGTQSRRRPHGARRERQWPQYSSDRTHTGPARWVRPWAKTLEVIRGLALLL
jgi:hypothetical protein